MAKHKKNQSKKDSVSDNLLDVTALSIKKYRKVAKEIAKLSPTQKLVGSFALLAAGYIYVNSMKNGNSEGGLLSELKAMFPQVVPSGKTPLSVPKQDESALQRRVALHKSPKTSKTGGRTGAFGKKAAASPHDE